MASSDDPEPWPEEIEAIEKYKRTKGRDWETVSLDELLKELESL